MLSSPAITTFNIFSSHSKISLFPYRYNASPYPSSIKFQKIHVEAVESQAKNDELSSKCENRTIEKDPNLGGQNAKGDNEEKGISGIHVPRQRYISVSKTALLDGILSMFKSQEDVDSFLQVSSCLDSILHAEHKGILEEMRIDYFLTHSLECDRSTTYDSAKSGEEEIMASEQDLAQDNYLGKGRMDRKEEMDENGKPLPFHYGLDLRVLLGSSIGNTKRNYVRESSVTVATRFQHAFMKLLRDAQFEELSARDLLLTSALNTDLTLPIYVDWKTASESNTIIFRRGYATERQKGLLIVEKLDYLQSKLLQGMFFILSRPLKQIGTWINESLKNASQTEELKVWLERVKPFLKDPPSSQRTHSYVESTFSDQSVSGQLSDGDPPIWLAAQRAVPLYEDLLSSAGPRGRLLRKLLVWIGFIPSIPETSFDVDNDSTILEPYLRPNFLSRIALSDIWEPATREHCGNNLMEMLRTAVSIFFSQSVLQEPAFEELILLYTEEMGQMDCKVEVPTLQLKIYERIPIPDLPVIFPHKKLSFRILDTVRLDVASILGLLAFFVNYKFEDILSSPSAFLLDVIASSALIIYVTRVALGYKQTWDRYQLLVNRTLYEKTLASGFGSVHFLLDASEQQQYKEAILAYGLLLQAENCQVHCGKSIRETCERFMYDKFNRKIEMPIDKAVETLLRLGLVTEVILEGNVRIQVVPCSEAYETLKQRWNGLLGYKA